MVKVEQGCDAWINNQNYIAAASTITAIWSAQWFKFFALNRNAAISTFSGRCVESHTINKCCHVFTPFTAENKKASRVITARPF
jgi:hypothetical protein